MVKLRLSGWKPRGISLGPTRHDGVGRAAIYPTRRRRSSRRPPKPRSRSGRCSSEPGIARMLRPGRPVPDAAGVESEDQAERREGGLADHLRGEEAAVGQRGDVVEHGAVVEGDAVGPGEGGGAIALADSEAFDRLAATVVHDEQRSPISTQVDAVGANTSTGGGLATRRRRPRALPRRQSASWWTWRDPSAGRKATRLPGVPAWVIWLIRIQSGPRSTRSSGSENRRRASRSPPRRTRGGAWETRSPRTRSPTGAGRRPRSCGSGGSPWIDLLRWVSGGRSGWKPRW